MPAKATKCSIKQAIGTPYCSASPRSPCRWSVTRKAIAATMLNVRKKLNQLTNPVVFVRRWALISWYSRTASKPIDYVRGHDFPHCRARATTTPADTCTGARRRKLLLALEGANFLLGIRRGRHDGAHVQSWCSGHECYAGCSRRIGPPGQRSSNKAARRIAAIQVLCN